MYHLPCGAMPLGCVGRVGAKPDEQVVLLAGTTRPGPSYRAGIATPHISFLKRDSGRPFGAAHSPVARCDHARTPASSAADFKLRHDPYFRTFRGERPITFATGRGARAAAEIIRKRAITAA